MPKKLLISVSLFGLLAACTTVSGPSYDPEMVDYGKAMNEEEAREAIINIYKNPEGVRIRSMKMYTGHCYYTMSGDLIRAGYFVSAEVNAQNGYGGYTGYEETHFFLRDHKVLKVDEDIVVDSVFTDNCVIEGYSPQS